jgi:hypothetical protein
MAGDGGGAAPGAGDADLVEDLVFGGACKSLGVYPEMRSRVASSFEVPSGADGAQELLGTWASISLRLRCAGEIPRVFARSSGAIVLEPAPPALPRDRRRHAGKSASDSTGLPFVGTKSRPSRLWKTYSPL